MAKQDANLIEKKVNDKFRAIGRSIVATEGRAEHTVRDALIACKGMTPEQIEHVKTGVQTAYQEKLNGLFSNNEFALPDNAINIRQAVYNRRSEKMAILAAFQLYAGMGKDEAALFDGQCDKAQSYHALVSLCRATVQVSKGDVGAKVKIISQKVSSKGFSVTLQRVERMDKNQLEKLLNKVTNAMKKFAAPSADVYKINTARKARKQAEAIAAMHTAKRKARKAA